MDGASTRVRRPALLAAKSKLERAEEFSRAATCVFLGRGAPPHDLLWTIRAAASRSSGLRAACVQDAACAVCTMLMSELASYVVSAIKYMSSNVTAILRRLGVLFPTSARHNAVGEDF